VAAEESLGLDESYFHYYFEIDDVIYTIKARSPEEAQVILTNDGITASLLEEVDDGNKSYLTRGCEGQLDLGMPPPIGGSQAMITAHKMLNETISNLYPPYHAIMIGRLSVYDTTDTAQFHATNQGSQQSALFRFAVHKNGSILEPVPDLLTADYIDTQVA